MNNIDDVKKAIQHLSRYGTQQVLEVLSDGEYHNVNDIWAETRLPDQPIVSQHLIILKNLNLVEWRRRGKHIEYRVIPHRYNAIHFAIQKMHRAIYEEVAQD